MSPSDSVSGETDSDHSASHTQEFYQDASSPSLQSHCRSLLSKVLGDESQRALVCELSGEGAQLMANYLDLVARNSDFVEARDQRRAVALLCNLAKSTQVFPEWYKLTGVRCSDEFIGSGGFADVYKGEHGGRAICLKAFRACQKSQENERLVKARAHELVLWAHLQHKNVLPFYGVHYLGGTLTKLCMISPWMEQGNLRNYLANFPEAPRMVFISDILAGLSYLHDLPIAHGDLKAENILISNNGLALITDFGTSFITATSWLMSVTSFGGTPRWMAPELLLADGKPRVTESCDIWSFASLCYEVLANKLPFYQYKSYQMLIAMMREEIPLRPEPAGSNELSDRLWDLLTACWNYEPKDRPTCKMLQASITEVGIQDNRPLPAGTGDSFGGTVGEGLSPELDYPRLQEILFRVNASASAPSPPPEGSTSNIQLTEPHPKCSPLPQSLVQSADTIEHASQSRTVPSMNTTKLSISVENVPGMNPFKLGVPNLWGLTGGMDIATSKLDPSDIIIAVMGPTGTGKSNFIDVLAGQPGKRASHRLVSGTSEVRGTVMKYDDGQNLVLVDTPGFDDTTRTDMEILEMIGTWLEKTYRKKIKLTGILYLHRITDNKMGGTPLKNFRMFGELCGYSALKRVRLVTTMWDKIQDLNAGETRERELEEVFWKVMLEKGCQVARFHNDIDSARGIIGGLIEERRVENLLLQEELVDLKRRLNETQAGQRLYIEFQRVMDERVSIKKLMAQIEGTTGPHTLEQLRKEQRKIEETLQETFEGVQQLEIPLGRRALRFLFGKTGKIKAFRRDTHTIDRHA